MKDFEKLKFNDSISKAYDQFMEQKPPPKKAISDIEDLKMKLEKLERNIPLEPEQDDCCGSGCTPCVFDTYYDRLERYEERKMELESRILEYEE